MKYAEPICVPVEQTGELPGSSGNQASFNNVLTNAIEIKTLF